jgi:hypothetical protein
MDQLLLDVRLGLCTLRKTPGLTLLIVLVLALGIAGSGSLFTIVDGLLVHFAPYRNLASLSGALTLHFASYFASSSCFANSVRSPVPSELRTSCSPQDRRTGSAALLS